VGVGVGFEAAGPVVGVGAGVIVGLAVAVAGSDVAVGGGEVGVAPGTGVWQATSPASSSAPKSGVHRFNIVILS